MDKMTEQDGASLNIVGENILALQTIFPEAFAENKVDFDVLRQLLGDNVDEGDEKYGINWHGKKKARQISLTTSTGTLRPCPEESIGWDTTGNLFIEGDNLEVLKLLQKSYAGKVKMIYIDPPYNTGNEFIYPDKFQDNLDTYLKYTGQKGEEGLKTSSNTESAGRYHTNWLNMIYPRLKLARNLLRDDGVIFISIDDGEVANLRKVCDEIFGEEDFLANIVWQKRTSPDARYNLGAAHDHILVYAKTLEGAKNSLHKLPFSEERQAQYKNPDNDPRGAWASVDMTGQTGHATSSQFYKIGTPSGENYGPPEGRCWALAEETFKLMCADGRIWFGANGKKAGYKTIAEIGKERIRRVAAKIKKENPDYKGDLGFKVFKLDSSNIRAWDPDRNDLEGALLKHSEHLIPGRSEEDILYELLLKRGVDLTVPIEQKEIADKTVSSIGYGVLFACLAPKISREDIENLAQGIAAWHQELSPATTQVVFRDSAFTDDVAKTNMTAILEQNGITHVRSL